MQLVFCLWFCLNKGPCVDRRMTYMVSVTEWKPDGMHERTWSLCCPGQHLSHHRSKNKKWNESSKEFWTVMFLLVVTYYLKSLDNYMCVEGVFKTIEADIKGFCDLYFLFWRTLWLGAFALTRTFSHFDVRAWILTQTVLVVHACYDK